MSDLVKLGLVLLGGYATIKLLDPGPPRRRQTRGWQAAERRACKRRRLSHRGGPGRADCGETVEVKEWARRIHAGVIEAEYMKGRREIVASSGFTQPARELARQLGVRLRRT